MVSKNGKILKSIKTFLKKAFLKKTTEFISMTVSDLGQKFIKD